MKRKIAVVTAVILASLIVTALLESITLEHVIGLSPSQSETMVILQKNAMDSLYSNVIGSFKSDYQLMTISRDGEILKTFQLPKDERFTFSDYDSMTVYDGYIYLHRMVKNPDDYFVLDEQVIRISAADGSIVVMFEAHYPEGVEYPLMTKMYRQGDMMMVVTDDETVEHTIHISQINLLTGTISALRTLKIDPELNLVDVLYLTSEDVVMSAADGKLYHFNEAGMSKIQYAGMPDLVRPEQLIAVGEERIAFYDHLSEDFVEMDLSAATYEVVREGEASVDVTRGLRYGDAFGLSITEDNVIAGSFRLNADHHRYIFLDDQRVMTVLDDLHYGSLHSFGIWCVSAAFFGLIAALVYALAALYRMRGGSLIVKFILILLPLVLIIPVIALSMSLGYFMQQVQNDLYAELYYIASEHVSDIDVQSVLALDNIEAYHSPAYYALDVDRQMTAVDYNDLVSDTFDRWYYSVVYRVEDDRIYTLVGDDVDYWIETRHIYGEKGNEAYLQAVTTGKTALGENSDTTGVWVFAVAPILDDSGDVVGLYEVGTGEESYLYFILSYYGKLSVIILGVAGIVLALMGIIIYRIILPLRNLNTSAKHIAAGEWGTTVSFNTMDEVGHLANAFNRMSLFIKDYINELTALNKLYYKFIPLRYFEMLKKDRISDVHNGDYSQQEMTIMHINAANYFEIVAAMDVEMQLSLLNQLFEVFSSAIHRQNGLIGEFRNSGLVAVFMSEEEAVNAAATIMQRMHVHFEKVKTTVVLHKGEVLLGIVGDEQRMNTTVISEAVNEVTSLSNFASRYRTGVLVTDVLAGALQGQLRYIGTVRRTAKEITMPLYEWLETLPVKQQQAFYQTKTAFDEAVTAYEADDFETAKKHFVTVIKGNRYDEISKIYLYKCEQLMAQESVHEPLNLTD